MSISCPGLKKICIYFDHFFQLLTSHFEQRCKYYSQAGRQGDQTLASEEELHLSRKLFWGVCKALAKEVRILNAYLDIDMVSKWI